ncbi:MAG TPA: sigma-70 family RNA polymerase sigma factor [Bacillota bacterium]|mgnify:FL=1|jgi:RNA polymerase sigma factor (sigma-70 family)|nr:sigma-70 family RNA polymerase sigma factor [Bacillota bacterium]HOI37218.1 sigma-70 family RNA polymerase sigma factor [Bacillota bacterium]
MPSGDGHGDADIRRHAGLAMYIAKRFAGRAELADLYQAGCVGLVRAMRTYDPARQTAFTTYAVPLIISEIRAYLRGSGPLHIPRPVRELGQRCREAHNALAAQLGSDPDVSQIAARLGISPADVAFAMDWDAPVRSLDEPAHSSPDSMSLLDAIPGEPMPEESVCDSLVLRNALGRLNPDARAVIVMRFFEERTQAQVATALGISQPQAHRIEKAALRELRQSMAGE